MKAALLVAVSVLVAGIIVGVSLDKLSAAVQRLNGTLLNRGGSPFPQHITVSPRNGSFRVSGDISSSQPASTAAAPAIPEREAFSRVQNVIVVSQNVTPAQLAEASQTLVGRWRDENSYVDYRADGTCTWKLDDGATKENTWRIEGDSIVESNGGKVAARRRLIEIGPSRFIYQQFPTGSLWRAWRVSDTPTPVAAPAAEKEPK